MEHEAGVATPVPDVTESGGAEHPAPMIDVIARFSFGANGSVRPFLREGWSVLEPDFTWTEGSSSRLVLPLTPMDDTLLLEIALTPLLKAPVLQRQRLRLSLNGQMLLDAAIAGECSLAFEIPAGDLGRAGLALVLDCPDAVSPQAIGATPDTRRLGFAVRDIMLFRIAARPPFTPITRAPLPASTGGFAQAVADATGLTLPDLASTFESLGHNCEFGLAQRAMGSETLGLLRFGGITLPKLLEGLDLEFEGIDASGNLTTYMLDGREEGEFMVQDRRYGTRFHTYLTAQTTTADAVLAMFTRNLAFLRRKFIEDIRTGGKIFVFQQAEANTLAHARSILNLLRSHGPNKLLFVTEDDAQPSGTVAQLDTDLMQGWITKLAPTHDVPKLDLASWIHICANAYSLSRHQT